MLSSLNLNFTPKVRFFIQGKNCRTSSVLVRKSDNYGTCPKNSREKNRTTKVHLLYFASASGLSLQNCNNGIFRVSQKRLSCYTCTVTVDQNNNTIGSGNIDCLSDNPSPSLIQECSSTQEYCTVDIEADWFGLGSARWTVRRGCSSNVSSNYQTQTSNSSLACTGNLLRVSAGWRLYQGLFVFLSRERL